MTMDFALLPNDDFFAARPLQASINKSLECRLRPNGIVAWVGLSKSGEKEATEAAQRWFCSL
jgi:hypothetical protein